MSEKIKCERKQNNACARGIKSVELEVVIKTSVVIGKGTEADPNRVVTQYWGLDGEFLCGFDPIENDLSEPGF